MLRNKWVYKLGRFLVGWLITHSKAVNVWVGTLCALDFLERAIHNPCHVGEKIIVLIWTPPKIYIPEHVFAANCCYVVVPLCGSFCWRPVHTHTHTNWERKSIYDVKKNWSEKNRLGFVDSLPPAKQPPPPCKALMTMIDNYNYIYIHKLMLNLKTNFFHYPLGATLGQRRLLSWTTTIYVIGPKLRRVYVCSLELHFSIKCYCFDSGRRLMKTELQTSFLPREKYH